MDDEVDLKKIVNLLNTTREEITEDIQYQEFVNLDDSDEDEENVEDEPSQLEEEYNFDRPIKCEISTFYKYKPMSCLKPEEEKVIDCCDDPDLKKILILNRQKNMKLIETYKKFKDLLIECQQNILDKSEVVKKHYTASKVQSQSSGSWRLGAPYFKDKHFYKAPLNDDAVRKKNNNELNYYDLLAPKKWYRFECERLSKSVKVHYNLSQIAEVKKKIKALSAAGDTNKAATQALELKLKNLKDREHFPAPPLGSDENIDWIRIAQFFVKDNHSDFECRSFWNIFLHPQINKSKWSTKESKELLELVKKYNGQNWDQIAKELGTNRSSLGVCIQYFSNYYATIKKGEFTLAEDRKLLELVKKYRIGNSIPWVKIVRHFKDRNRAQLHHRFTYYLSQFDKKRGKFTDAEDVIIMLCVERFGRNFKKCAEYLPERSHTQIKSRYTSGLKRKNKKTMWTKEDDQTLVDFVQNKGQLWTQVSEKLLRTPGQVRQRYFIVKSFLDNHPQSTIEDVPRRQHNGAPDSQKFSMAGRLVDQLMLKPYIPSVPEIEQMLAQMKQPPANIEDDIDDEFQDESKLFSNVDDLLTEYFWTNSDQGDIPKLSPDVVNEIIDDVEILLDTLKVNLDIPKNLKRYPNLDVLDKKILTELSKRRPVNNVATLPIFENILPPSFYTTTGIRSLIIKNLRFKSSSDQRIFGNMDLPTSVMNRAKSSIHKELNEVSKEERIAIEMDRSIFYQRFLCIFKWPAVMTVEDPSKDLLSISEGIDNDFQLRRPPVKRTYSNRLRTNPGSRAASTSTSSKVRILDEDVKEALQLKPVTNKSVIMNLLKDTSKKLFCLDEVKCGDATNTLIKEVDLKFLPSRSDNGNAALSSTAEDIDIGNSNVANNRMETSSSDVLNGEH